MPHIHDLYDFAVCLYITHQDTVLLVEHPRYNKWLPVGGHIDLDEDPEQTIYREAKEETGLSITLVASSKPDLAETTSKPLPTPNFMDVADANPPHKHIHLTYFARSETTKTTLSSEHTSLHWFTEPDLADTAYGVPLDVQYYSRLALAASRAEPR